MKNTNKGFTLLELLVVIAIVGVLASIIMVSVSTTRQKARDAQRVSDIRQIRNALALYFSDNQYYPNNLSSLVTGGYLPVLAGDPLGGAYEGIKCRPDYCYAYAPSSNPTAYHLAAQLELDNTVLTSDADCTSIGGISNTCVPGVIFTPPVNNCGRFGVNSCIFNGVSTPVDYIYDVKPQ